jgi:hypothetical protein
MRLTLIGAFIFFFSLGGYAQKKVRISPAINTEKQYLVLQLEKANLYFLKEDVLSESKLEVDRERDQANKELLSKAISDVTKMKFDTLLLPLKIDPSVKGDAASAHVLLYLSFKNLLTKGSVSIRNKANGKFENEFAYKKVKSKNGTGISYCLKNGSEFYYDVISIKD